MAPGAEYLFLWETMDRGGVLTKDIRGPRAGFLYTRPPSNSRELTSLATG